MSGAGFWLPPSGGGGGGGTTELLALHSYAAAANGTLASTSSSTPADVHVTSAAVSFTAPTSGVVLVRVTALQGGSSSAGDYYWQLRDGGVAVGTQFISNLGISLTPAFRTSAAFRVTGLVSGAAKTYTLGHYRNTGGTWSIFTGPTFGPLVMEVWAA